VGFLPGKRESRRFIGLHTLTQDDVMRSRAFDDAIAYGGWPIDMHPPRGVDAPGEQPCEQHAVPNLYDIPLRCCISRDVENLMFAGRNMSATHVAFSSTRVMATCFVVGQGVGVAAAHAVALKTSPAALPGNREAMKVIQQTLLRDDCYLIGLRNEDDADMARDAHVTASSEQPDGPASAVLSGQTRSVHGDGGAPADRARPGAHRWMSDLSSGLPAWLMLSWDRPIRPREIRIVFDTGLHRVLTMSHADAYAARMHWGRPQPETVRDYTIEGRMDGHWHTLDEVRDNYQRLRIHRLSQPPTINALRITVHSTNGLDHARIAETRVYT